MKNRWIAVMLVFVTALYAFLLISHFFFRDEEAMREREERVKVNKVLVKEKEKTALRHLEKHPELAGALSLGFAAVFFWGLYLDARLGMRIWRKKPLVDGAVAHSETRWGARDVFQSFLFLLFLEGSLFLIQSIVWVIFRVEGPVTDSALLLNSLARNLGVVCFIVWIVQRRYGHKFTDIGLGIRGFWQHVRTGILAYIAVIPPLALCFVILAAVLKFFSIEPEPQAVVEMYLKESTQPYLIFLTLFVAAAGPVMEELFFRGFAYAGLRKRFGVWPGAVLGSLIFAGFHLHWTAFFPIFFLGMFLTALYQTSGSLVPSITAHVLHNGVMVGVILVFRNISSG